MPEGTLIRVREEPESGAHRGRPSLFCIHGAGMSSVVWMDMVRRLAPGHHVIAPDLPGHGQSEPGPPLHQTRASNAWWGEAHPALPGEGGRERPPLIDGYRDAVLAILAAMKVERAILCGHSMGAAIALRVALSRPDRVAGLVICNSGARLRVSAELLQRLGEALPGGGGGGNNDGGPPDNPFVDRMPDVLGDLSFSPQTLPDVRARWQAVLLSARRETVLGDFRACDGFDVRGEVPRLRLPALFLAGEDDLLVPPKVVQGSAALIPGAQLHIIAGTGHLSHLERPDAVHAILLPFLSSIS